MANRWFSICFSVHIAGLKEIIRIKDITSLHFVTNPPLTFICIYNFVPNPSHCCHPHPWLYSVESDCFEITPAACKHCHIYFFTQDFSASLSESSTNRAVLFKLNFCSKSKNQNHLSAILLPQGTSFWIVDDSCHVKPAVMQRDCVSKTNSYHH